MGHAEPRGVLCHPAPLYEILFHLSLGLVFVVALRRRWWSGTFFARYLLAYGAFRFATEFLRVTPKFIGPLSVYQLGSVLLMVCGVWALVRYGGRARGPRKEGYSL